MINDEKSIAYAFIANGVQIYLNEEEDFFVISKLVCQDCNNSWYMNLTECFLCGAVNSFLYKCSSCGEFQSITKSNNKCSNCNSTDLYMVCPNKNCISNTNKEVFKEANDYGGVFNKNSGLLISQQYCLNCGSKYHKYKNYEIYVRSTKSSKIDFKKLNIDINKLSENSYLIIKYHNEENKVKYSLYKVKDIINKDFSLDDMENHFSSIVMKLYPVQK